MARRGSWASGVGTRGRRSNHPLVGTLDKTGGRSFESDRHVAAAAVVVNDPSWWVVDLSFRGDVFVKRTRPGTRMASRDTSNLEETLGGAKERQQQVSLFKVPAHLYTLLFPRLHTHITKVPNPGKHQCKTKANSCDDGQPLAC